MNTAHSLVLNAAVPPSIPDGLRLARHDKLALYDWKPQLLCPTFPERLSHKTRTWDTLGSRMHGATFWNACCVDFLLAHPETARCFAEEWGAACIVFPGTEYKQLVYRNPNSGHVTRRKPRSVFRALKISAERTWIEVVKPRAEYFMYGRDFIAVLP